MNIYVDIDDTICTYIGNREYPKAVPIQENIDKINSLYDEGNTIVYWTARGGTTGLDWTDLTHKQLKKWKVKYHEIKMGKPPYDLFICDKAINTEVFFNQGEKNE
jgi:hypothetical protein